MRGRRRRNAGCGFMFIIGIGNVGRELWSRGGIMLSIFGNGFCRHDRESVFCFSRVFFWRWTRGVFVHVGVVGRRMMGSFLVVFWEGVEIALVRTTQCE